MKQMLGLANKAIRVVIETVIYKVKKLSRDMGDIK